MGKGTGKLATWMIELPSGVVIFEFKNLRYGRSHYFANQVRYRIPCMSTFISYSSKRIPLFFYSNVKVAHDSFW